VLADSALCFALPHSHSFACTHSHSHTRMHTLAGLHGSNFRPHLKHAHTRGELAKGQGGGGGDEGKRHGRGMGQGKAWRAREKQGRGKGEAREGHGIGNLLPAHDLSLLTEIAASHHQAVLPDETVVGARAPAHGTPSSPPACPAVPRSSCRSPPGLQPCSTHSTLSLHTRRISISRIQNKRLGLSGNGSSHTPSLAPQGHQAPVGRCA